MRLTDFSDYSIRTLIYLNRVKTLTTLSQLSASLNIPRNHLNMVAHKLVRLGYLRSTRGRYGGFQIEDQAGFQKIGDILRSTENQMTLVECFSEPIACPLFPNCQFKKALGVAMDSFFSSLNGLTLDQIS